MGSDTPAEVPGDLAGSADQTSPSILINTMPKSGSVYLTTALAAGLRLERADIGNGYTLDDQINYWAAKRFAGTGKIAQNHFAPSAINVQIMNAVFGRWVVHVRDPRQALLSWVHHVDLFLAEGRQDFLLWFAPTIPAGYADLDLSRKLDWNIKHYYPGLVGWLNGWLKILDSGSYDILLTRHDELVSDEAGLCHRILEFYGVKRDYFIFSPPCKDRSTHFRRGDPDEWREVLSRKQIKSCNRRLPPDLLARFGWEP